MSKYNSQFPSKTDHMYVMVYSKSDYCFQKWADTRTFFLHGIESSVWLPENSEIVRGKRIWARSRENVFYAICEQQRCRSSVVRGKRIWARSCENVFYAICEQQRCRSACASAQSDQHLCCSLLRQYDMYTCSIQSFKILASFCSWADWFESYLVKSHIFAWCGSYNV